MSSEELLIDDHEFETPIYVSVAKFEESRVRRDKQGRFAEKASVTVDGRDIQVVKPLRATAAGDKLVAIDTEAFDVEFARQRDFYIGVGGQGGISNRYERFGQFIAENESIEAAEVNVDEQGRVGFTNGRHRYAFLRDKGVKHIPVAMTPESAANAKKHGLLAKVKKWDPAQPRDKKGRWSDDDDLSDDVLYAETAEDIQKALTKAGAEPLKIGGKPVAGVHLTKNYVVEWDGEDSYANATRKDEWIHNANVDEYFPDEEERFNQEFWEGGGEVYHATTEENIAEIEASGLEPRSFTRGMSNRSEGPGVYTTVDVEETAEEHYGTEVFAIDIGAMRQDKLMPFASREPDVVEGELREALAHAIGLDDYSYDYEHGMSPNTVALSGHIPAKYLTHMFGRQKWDESKVTRNKEKGHEGEFAAGGGADGPTVKLYRGDAATVSPALDYSDPGALFGAGIYLTDSKRIAGDYGAKGGAAEEVFRFGGGPKNTKQDAIDRYVRQLATQYDAEGKKLFWAEPLSGYSGHFTSPELSAKVKSDEARLAHAQKAWDEMQGSMDVRKLADNTIVIYKKRPGKKGLGHVSEYEIPESWTKKTLDAEAEITDDVATALYSVLRKGNPGLANDVYDRAMQKDENGFRPTFREVYAEGKDSMLVGGLGEKDTQLRFRRALKELGFKGIRYAGGITMGGARHTAYVFWDEQGLKKRKRKWDVVQSIAEKGEHAYGNTQIAIAPTSKAAGSLNLARSVIFDEHCMGTGKDVDPNHVTVRYGLLNDDLDGLRSFIAQQRPFEAQLGEIELFPVSEHSEGAVPVVALILSPELHEIEAEIGKHADFKEKNFPVYKPHCTLAYCKPEHAESYRNLLVYGSFVVQSITISHQSGVQETIPFGLTQKWNPQQPRDEQGRWETVHPDTIRTEKEMVPAKGAADIMAHARAGRMPLDAEKIKALEKIIRAGGELPPLDVREDGVLNDGHHRLQAFRNVGATSVRIIRQKWDPNQPRDEKGRFKGLGLHGSEVTVLHGTTRANAEAILAGGFKQGNPKAVAEQIEREYGLPEGSIYEHVAFEFARGRRDLDEVHFTTDESVADQYAVPEVMQDALTAAHMLLNPHPEDEPYTKEHHAQRKAWVTEQANRLREPALLAVTVPFETVGQHSFGKALTLAEFQEIQRKFPKSDDWFNNIRIPITALREARVERWKREGSTSFHNRPHWAESKHPRHPAGSSQGGEFMATLHGPRDAVDALLEQDRDVNIQAGDVRRFMEIAGELPEGIDPDLTKLLVEGQKIFGGTNGLGIIRDDMPQIPPEHRDQFLEFLEQEHGVKVTRGEQVDPLTLRPTQSQVSARRAGAKLKKYEDNPKKKFPAVLVSNADRILDGHHHWGMMAAFALEAPGARMPVTRIHLPTRKTLALMHAYMKRHGLKRATLAGSTVAKADPATGRYVTPFVSFEKQGDNLLRMIASLNSSRLATWGFTAEAEVLGMARYKLTAVLDGRTSKFCRLVAHGKIFDVVDARAKVIEALNVQNPEDLRQVQPWPKQDKASMAMYREMSNAELVERGLHIPPYHPHCRTILRHVQSSIGKAKEPPVSTLPAGVETFHPITAADLRELGIEATPEQVAQWNETVGMSPVELISKLTGMPPVEVLTKGKGVGANPVQIDPDGNVGVRARGTTPSGVEFKLNAILDPFTGIFYLNEAALIAGTPAAELKFLKNLFTELIDTGLKTSASSVAVGVAGNAAYYARMGFLPDDIEWDGLRTHTLQELETGSLQPLFKSLTPNDQVLVKQLLQDKSSSALSALVELPFTYEGRTLGEWILAEASGTWGLDLLDPSMVAHAKSYLT